MEDAWYRQHTVGVKVDAEEIRPYPHTRVKLVCFALHVLQVQELTR